MGLLNKIFGQNSNTEKPNETQPSQQLPPCKSEQELIERFGGNALDKQMDLGEVIGDNNWNVDMTKGEISFGPNLVFPIQVLGTFSHSSATWLWAWANTQSGLSESIMQQALQLKKYGEENNVDLLRNDQFAATKNDLHLIGLIASGMFAASGYYVADYGQGAMVVTVKSAQIDKTHKDNHHRILMVFPQLISLFEMNHRTAMTNYLSDKGYAISSNETQLTGKKNAQTITAIFDELHRLVKLNG